MVLGIDLGTTNSLACVYKNGEVVQIPNFMDEYLTPSVVSIGNDGSIIVGQSAKERKETHPEMTFSSFKRFMGTNKKFGKFSAEELSSFILRGLKQDAEKFLGETIEDVIISVPAYFNDKARNATKNAGKLAGLNVLRIINEPSAASLGYLMKSGKLKQLDDMYGFEDNIFLVFDFGGGTLDVSLVESFENVIEILGVSGDNQLGGIDFDDCLAKEFLKRKNIVREAISSQEYNAILSSAERCKKELTENKKARMIVHTKKINAEIEITDSDYLRICEKVIRRISEPINSVLLDSQIKGEDISGVVLVGGSSKMPLVQQYLKHIMRGMKISVFDPDYMIAYGMGVYAGIMERQIEVKDLLMTDVCSYSLGVSVANHTNSNKTLMSVIIPRNTALPISKTECYSPSHENQEAIFFRVFQGEEMYADDNKKIGEIEIKFPSPAPMDTPIFVTFTYDVNCILLVNIKIARYGIDREIVIKDPENADSKDIESRVKKLKEFRLKSVDESDDVFIREWGEKLYVIAPSELKDEIRFRLGFLDVIEKKDPYQAIKFKKNIKQFFLAIELGLSQYAVANWQLDDTWAEEADAEVESIFKEWEDSKKD